VYYLSTDGHVQELGWLGDHWETDDVFGEVINPPAGGMPPADLDSGIATMGTGGNPSVYYLSGLSPDFGHVQQLVFAGQWETQDLQQATSSPNLPLAILGVPDHGDGLRSSRPGDEMNELAFAGGAVWLSLTQTAARL
jgi:hypothetical protein